MLFCEHLGDSCHVLVGCSVTLMSGTMDQAKNEEGRPKKSRREGGADTRGRKTEGLAALRGVVHDRHLPNPVTQEADITSPVAVTAQQNASVSPELSPQGLEVDNACASKITIAISLREKGLPK